MWKFNVGERVQVRNYNSHGKWSVRLQLCIQHALLLTVRMKERVTAKKLHPVMAIES